MYLKKIVNDWVEAVAALNRDEAIPKWISKTLIVSPEAVLDLLSYYLEIPSNKNDNEAACLKLILECLDRIRYELDRKSERATLLLHTIEERLSYIFSNAPPEKLIRLNEVLYESHLDFTLETEAQTFIQPSSSMPDIVPKLPELLEIIRKEHRIRSSFDLYDGLMSQLKLMPADIHLQLTTELAMTKKSIPHEVAVMMLLHPKKEIREQIIFIFKVSIIQNVATPIDLRRLVMIRNWLPSVEQSPIDDCIKAIRLQGIAPAPSPMTKIDAIMASAFDGAGAQLILFRAKQMNHRVIAGFILKFGVGIREPWVNLKTSKHEYDTLFDNKQLAMKPVSVAYVNKAVRHFLAEGHAHGNIPSPYFLQIAELLRATEWQPEYIHRGSELNRLRSKVEANMILKDAETIQSSFERSADWYHSESFFRHWFECGDIAERQLMEAIEIYKQSKENEDNNLETLVLKKVIEPVLEKWKTLFLFMCLWARSKQIKNPLWFDLLTLLEQLESNTTKLTEIPVMIEIARQTAASCFMRAELQEQEMEFV